MDYTDLTDTQFRQAMQEFKAESDQRHRETVSRIEAMNKQLAELTVAMVAIKVDTGQIVSLFKASQFGAMIVKWCATVGGAIIVGYAAWKGLTS